MREPENIRQLAGLGIDYIGFIFYPPSKRFVESIDKITLNALPKDLKRTGVFVDASKEEILQRITQFGLNALQLHGAESPELCSELRQTGLEIIKAFGVDEDFEFDILKSYEGKVDYFLFDTKTKQHGGSGLTFDWRLLDSYKLTTPYLLSGGLDEYNIFEALELEDRRFYGLDLNSRFEISPALKDIEKLKTVIHKLKGIPA